jgi:3-phenylpropionate/trans-cinnamate dioxygenase ferredoxin reductase subunit
MADDSGAPVHYLRTIEDSDLLRALLTAGTRLALVGGGWIGREVAAAAVAAGAHVTVLESAELSLVGVLGPEVAARFASLHRDHGVDVRVQVTLEAIEQTAGGALLRLAAGAAVEVDQVLVGIGAVPDTALMVAAGLTVDNGIRTDEHLRTSVPDMYAAGDVANALHPALGRHVRRSAARARFRCRPVTSGMSARIAIPSASPAFRRASPARTGALPAH